MFDLNEHIKELKRKGVIRFDSDIAKDLNITKGNLSNYISGKLEPSKNFIEKFCEFYNILEHSTKIVSEPDVIYGNKHTKKDDLQMIIEQKDKIIEQQQKMIESLLANQVQPQPTIKHYKTTKET